MRDFFFSLFVFFSSFLPFFHRSVSSSPSFFSFLAPLFFRYHGPQEHPQAQPQVCFCEHFLFYFVSRRTRSACFDFDWMIARPTTSTAATTGRPRPNVSLVFFSTLSRATSFEENRAGAPSRSSFEPGRRSCSLLALILICLHSKLSLSLLSFRPRRAPARARPRTSTRPRPRCSRA